MSHRIFLGWFLREFASAPSSYNYECLGWEVLDGHECLKIKVDRIPGPPSPTNTFLMIWIDLKRGGHPLAIEWRTGEVLEVKVHSIVLDEFALSESKRVWYPMRGIADFYRFGSKFMQYPVTRENYGVVKGSIVFNKGLSDGIFTCKGNGPAPGPDVLGIRKQFDDIQAKPKPRPRTDPEGVQQGLDRKLAEADRQSKVLEAPSAARYRWDWSSLLQLGMIGVGVASISSGAVLWRRSRR